MPLFVVYGTCPAGLASSFHTVPLYTLSLVPALSVVMVTTVPAGDVSVMSRSPGKVGGMKVVMSTSRIEVPARAMTIDEVITAGPPGMAVGVDCVAAVLAVVGALGKVVTASDQLSRLPPSTAGASEMVSVQVPLGFSPMKAASGSSATSGVAVTPMAYA